MPARALTIAALLALFTACGGDTEGVFPGECDDSQDNDADGLFDCNDPDCNTDIACTGGGDADTDADTKLAEECDNSLDDDSDGLFDCNDPDCSAAVACNPSELWSFRGTGTVTSGTSLTETVVMIDEVFNNYNGTYNIGDVLCEAHYTHVSTGVSTTTCTGCTFAFDMAEGTLDTTFGGGDGYEGPLCDTWYDFTSGGGFDVLAWPGMGYHPAYSYNATTYPAAMTLYNSQWYAMTLDAQYNSATGAFTFDWPRDVYTY